MFYDNKFFVLRFHRPQSDFWSAYGIDQSGFFNSFLTTEQLIHSVHFIFNSRQLIRLGCSKLAQPRSFGFDSKYAGRKVIPTDNFIRDYRALKKYLAINCKGEI